VSPIVIRMIPCPIPSISPTSMRSSALFSAGTILASSSNSRPRVQQLSPGEPIETLREFQLRPREAFLYTCGAIDLWEWEFRVLNRHEELTATTRRSVWAVVAPFLGNTALARRVSHEAEAAKAGRGDVHTRADGGGDRKACRAGPGRSRTERVPATLRPLRMASFRPATSSIRTTPARSS
jgi:hypothetical protein